MKKAFSLFELIIVVILISILVAYIAFNSKDSIDFTIKTKIKSDIALIKASLTKMKTKKILLNSSDEQIQIDEASLNQQGSLLFKNLLDTPLVSTSEYVKEKGKWIKMSEKDYMVFLSKEIFLKFSFENNLFTCKSNLSLCEEYE